MKYFYAVRIGRAPGVYTNWSDCEKQVKGYPKAAFKKFPTEQLAWEFVNLNKGILGQDGPFVPPITTSSLAAGSLNLPELFPLGSLESCSRNVLSTIRVGSPHSDSKKRKHKYALPDTSKYIIDISSDDEYQAPRKIPTEPSTSLLSKLAHNDIYAASNMADFIPFGSNVNDIKAATTTKQDDVIVIDLDTENAPVANGTTTRTYVSNQPLVQNATVTRETPDHTPFTISIANGTTTRTKVSNQPLVQSATVTRETPDHTPFTISNGSIVCPTCHRPGYNPPEIPEACVSREAVIQHNTSYKPPVYRTEKPRVFVRRVVVKPTNPAFKKKQAIMNNKINQNGSIATNHQSPTGRNLRALSTLQVKRRLKKNKKDVKRLKRLQKRSHPPTFSLSGPSTMGLTEHLRLCRMEGDLARLMNTIDKKDAVQVYTDGACSNNGKRNAKAAIGVWWGDDSPLNISRRIDGRQTNNRAEIHAAVEALKTAKAMGYKKIVLYTDSNFLIQGITQWIEGWKKRDWTLSTGGEVKNKEDFQELDEARQGLQVKWVHVKGHCGIHGNEMADKLATSALNT